MAAAPIPNPQAKRYDQAFKQQAVEHWLRSGKPATQVAAALGVSYPTLKKWRRASTDPAGCNDPASHPMVPIATDVPYYLRIGEKSESRIDISLPWRLGLCVRLVQIKWGGEGLQARGGARTLATELGLPLPHQTPPSRR